MPRYEYKLVPAPERATRIKGLKGAASFAATLESLMNELGAAGWTYMRAETLPQEERSGLTSRTTTYRNLLVFQRLVPETPPAADHAQTPREDRADPQPHVPAPPQPRLAPVAAPAAPPDRPDPAHDTEDEPSLANLFADSDPDPDRDDTVKP